MVIGDHKVEGPTIYLDTSDFNMSNWAFQQDGGGQLSTSVFGNSDANYIVGSSHTDIIYGGDGDDTLRGGMFRGAGDSVDDFMFGGANDDRFVFSIADGPLSAQGDIADGGTGTDTIVVDPSGEELDLRATTFVSIEAIQFSSGGTAILRDAQFNSFGEKIINRDLVVTGTDQVGSTEQLKIILVDGSDFNMSTWTFQNWGGQDELITVVGIGSGTLVGSSQNDFLSGGSSLVGNAGDDILNGDGGPGGNTTMIGGPGDDIYYVDQASDSVTEYVDEGIDEVRSASGFTLSPNVENLTLTGTDNLNGSGNELGNTILGNSGNNRLYGFAGEDGIFGGGGDDVIFGGQGTDSMAGKSGNDTFWFYVSDGALANEVIDGGEDMDTIWVTADPGASMFDFRDATVSSIEFIVFGFEGGGRFKTLAFNDDQLLTTESLHSDAQLSSNNILEVSMVNGGDFSAAAFELGDWGIDLGNWDLDLGNYTLVQNDAIIVRGGDAADTITASSRVDRIFGGAGDDTIQVEGFDTRTQFNSLPITDLLDLSKNNNFVDGGEDLNDPGNTDRDTFVVSATDPQAGGSDLVLLATTTLRPSRIGRRAPTRYRSPF